MPKAKPRVEMVSEALIVVRRGTTVLLRQRQAGERWAGLWDFPRFGVAANGSLAEEIAEKLTATTGVVAAVAEPLVTLKHGVTRFRITLDCRWADCISAPRRRPGLRWLRPAQLSDFPMSTTGRKVAKLICERSEE